MAKNDDSYIKSGNKVSVSATIDPEIAERLEAFLTKNKGAVKSRFIEKAIKELLDREEKKK